jgi:enoyl-[acyl-carrier protein] reductase II
MAWISDAKLAAAVSEAGGLGVIAAGGAPADMVASEIKLAKSLTSKPFGVNVMLMSPNAGEVAEVVAKLKPAVVTTGAGNASAFAKMWIDAGIHWIPVIPSIAVAVKSVRNGACAVIAEGGESGGHVGELTAMCLVPQICDAVNVPVLAAGGIGDGRGIAAAFMLGAVGVQVGTRFLVARECGVHQNYKDKIIKAKEIDSVVTGKRLGHPVRALKTPFTRKFLAYEYDSSITNEQLEELGAGSLRAAAIEGDNENGSFMAGQIAGLIKKEQSASEIITEMFAEAEKILHRAKQWVK